MINETEKFITSNDVLKLIEKHGIKNIVAVIPLRPLHDAIFMSYTLSSDKPVKVPCKIIETRYKVSENYKIEFQSLIKGYGKEQFYISDFANLLRDKTVKLYAKIC